MQITTHCHSGDDTGATLDALATAVQDQPHSATAVIALYDAAHDPAQISAFVQGTFPDAAWIGGSSSGGVVDSAGAHDGGAIGLWVFADPQADVGSASASKGADPATAAEAALKRAIANAGCEGDLPDLVWVLLSPGAEEAVLDGFRRVIGDRCPIVGGSTADNDLSGAWSQCSPEGAHDEGFAVMAFFCSSPPEVCFRGGYEPTENAGIATVGASQGDGPGAPARILQKIDGRPAASVYNDWTGGAIAKKLNGGSVLAETSMFPLGIETGMLDGVPQYLLVHPETVIEDGALTTFADVAPGARLHCMTGSKSLLVDRAGTVARQARHLLQAQDPPSGALMIYCGGCRMAVEDGWKDLSATIGDALSGAPFLVGFTFGEQGPTGGRNAHGNLMISAVVFP